MEWAVTSLFLLILFTWALVLSWFRLYLNGLVIFSCFLQFKSEFGNKEFMIWATVSSQSYFYWLYRASPSLAAKNIINLIFIFMIWWSPRVVSSLMLLEEGVSNDQGILLAKLLLAFALLHFVLLRPSLSVTPGISRLSTFVFNPLWWNGYLFLVLVLEGPVGLHRTI